MSEAYNAGERRHVRAAAKAARADDLATRTVVVGLMDTTDGRRWVYGLLERSHIFASTFSANALTMAFAEGERNIGLQLLAEITAACPNQYTLMIQEKYARDRAHESARKQPIEPEFDAAVSYATEFDTSATDAKPDE